MGIDSQLCFQFGDVVLLIHKVLMALDNCVFLAVDRDGDGILTGQSGDLGVMGTQILRGPD